MAKTPKQKKRDLAHRLHRLGLRKELAKRIADNATNVGGQLPSSARKTIKEMRAKVDDLGAGVFKTAKGEDQEDEGTSGKTKAPNPQQKKAVGRKLTKKAKKMRKKAQRAAQAAKPKAKEAKEAKEAKKARKAKKSGRPAPE